MLFLALLPFSVSATPAIQDAVASHFVHFSGGMSPLSLATGPLSLAALSTEVAGHFDTNLQKAQHELEEYKQKGQGLWHTFLQRVTSGRFYWAFVRGGIFAACVVGWVHISWWAHVVIHVRQQCCS